MSSENFVLYAERSPDWPSIDSMENIDNHIHVLSLWPYYGLVLSLFVHRAVFHLKIHTCFIWLERWCAVTLGLQEPLIRNPPPNKLIVELILDNEWVM